MCKISEIRKHLGMPFPEYFSGVLATVWVLTETVERTGKNKKTSTPIVTPDLC